MAEQLMRDRFLYPDNIIAVMSTFIVVDKNIGSRLTGIKLGLAWFFDKRTAEAYLVIAYHFNENHFEPFQLFWFDVFTIANIVHPRFTRLEISVW
ncbi:MAG: hypothetical protein GTO18_05165 [Anaerolineales bacterium]|nr:hypothetical protein [Anaerolineales bacterium]